MQQLYRLGITISIIVWYCSYTVNCIMEERIIEILEEFRNRMCHPLPQFHLPALDPLKVDYFKADLDNKYFIGLILIYTKACYQ